MGRTNKGKKYTKETQTRIPGEFVRLFTTPNDIYKDKQMEHAIQEIREKYP